MWLVGVLVVMMLPCEEVAYADHGEPHPPPGDTCADMDALYAQRDAAVARQQAAGKELRVEMEAAQPFMEQAAAELQEAQRLIEEGMAACPTP